MLTMSAFAKINWALAVTGRGEDGYHTLDMLMQRISIGNVLSVEPDEELRLLIDGEEVSDPGCLILRAANALREETGATRGALFRLTRRVPDQAGLGAASADCAAALRLLNTLWRLGLEDEALARIGIRLGADVPFSLRGGLARVTGIGERIAPILPAPRVDLVVCKPADGVPTAEAFRRFDAGIRENFPAGLDNAQKALCNGDWDALRRFAGNDLQPAAEELVPDITGLAEALYGRGALFAAMSGSGSAVFGVFPDGASASEAAAGLGGDGITVFTAHTMP